MYNHFFQHNQLNEVSDFRLFGLLFKPENTILCGSYIDIYILAKIENKLQNAIYLWIILMAK